MTLVLVATDESSRRRHKEQHEEEQGHLGCVLIPLCSRLGEATSSATPILFSQLHQKPHIHQRPGPQQREGAVSRSRRGAVGKALTAAPGSLSFQFRL